MEAARSMNESVRKTVKCTSDYARLEEQPLVVTVEKNGDLTAPFQRNDHVKAGMRRGIFLVSYCFYVRRKQ